MRLEAPASPADSTGTTPPATIRSRLALGTGLVGLVALALATRLFASDLLVLLSDPPPAWLPVGAAGVLLLRGRTLPRLAVAYALVGFLSLAWSLAPGATLIALQWELALLGAVAAGTWRPAYLVAATVLLLSELELALPLNLVGEPLFVSGSVHYLLGAAGVAVLPLALAWALRPGRGRWGRRRVVPAVVVAGVALMGALASGSRAALVPLPLVATAALIVAFAARGRGGLTRLLTVGLATVAVALALGYGLPGQPAVAGLDRIAGRVADTGGVGTASSSRSRYWVQTLSIAVARPQGAGVGSYPDVIHAYQRFPMSWSNSPHNVFVETAATGGWLRLLLLVALLAVGAWRTANEGRWLLVASVAAVWITLALDITASIPQVMLVGFAGIGALHAAPPPGARERIRRPGRMAGALAVAVAGLALTGWWYLPSEAPAAFAQRLGERDQAIRTLADASPEEAKVWFEHLRSLYPQSLWVVQLAHAAADDPAERLELAREIALRFPLHHPYDYSAWADAAVAAGDPGQAAGALRAGLETFPTYPFAERRWTREGYQAWVDETRTRLALLEAD